MKAARDDKDGGGDGGVTGSCEEQQGPPPQAEQPGHRALVRGNGGENLGVAGNNAAEHIRNAMEAAVVEYLRQQVVAGKEPASPAMLRTPEHLLRRVRFPIGATSSSQLQGSGVPRRLRVSATNYRRGLDLLAERTRENERLRGELEASRKECASLREEVARANEKAAAGKAAVAEVLVRQRGVAGGAGLLDRVPMCVLCLFRSATVVLLPCDHLCLCKWCASARRTCPLCLAEPAN